MLYSLHETGQALVEILLLLLVFLAVAVLLTLVLLGPTIGNVFLQR